ncbi:protein WVD2-like 7 isoform X1 [Juglans microcarpa x Juglans regia]|uniref:protein WVD2-like 7 isoform X1 n=1 Tax=Juglans microcarpa x Juglans regia TaxID=2249226 RepID=UPI001B7E0B85|nr:protein WVD2-like 7 isoform X1 [Juglans microcarpa x Juglans regia]
MGESATCLVRSFSHPSHASSEAKERDPFRALGESISFGRFMSESLAWEKRSTFSHNPYLEEVEKFSKPGSVAQKKAYFEAHYKKKAAERAAALLEEANTTACIVFESESMDKLHDDSFMDLALVKADSLKAIDEPHGDDTPNTAVGYSVYANGDNPNVGVLETKKVEAADAVTQEGINLVEISDQTEKVEDYQKIVASQKEKKLDKDAVYKEILPSPSKKRQGNFSQKLSTKSRASKLPVSPSEQMISMQSINENYTSENSKKVAGDLVDKKRSLKSLHMSINLASRTCKTSKTTTPVSQKVRSKRTDATLFNTFGHDSSISVRTMTSASVNKLMKERSVKPQSEDRSTRTLLSNSVSAGITEDRKGQSLPIDCSNSSSVSRSKARSPTISFPFTFRSQERAAKRKEFFQKLEEQINTKEAEKWKQQTMPKEKAHFDIKKLRQTTEFKAKLHEDSNHGSQSPSSPLKKSPRTKPQSLKLGRNPVQSKVQDSSSRPPLKPSGRNVHSNQVMEKVDQSTSRSIISLTKKKARENASPNIQH